MTENARRAIGFVLAREGGYSDHPADRGGRTYKGISERAHPEAWKDGPPSDAEVESIYEREYWQPIHGDMLPYPVALVLMDFSVHSGVKTAWRYLKSTLGLHHTVGLADVLEVIQHAPDPKAVAQALIIERAMFLVRNALSVPKQDVFAKGFIARMVELKHAVEAA